MNKEFSDEFLTLISWIKRGKQRKFILKHMDSNEPIFPTELMKLINSKEKEIKLSLPEVSRHLLEFEKKEIVKCLDKNLPWGRSYLILGLGLKIKEFMKL